MVKTVLCARFGTSGTFETFRLSFDEYLERYEEIRDDPNLTFLGRIPAARRDCWRVLDD